MRPISHTKNPTPSQEGVSSAFDADYTCVVTPVGPVNGSVSGLAEEGSAGMALDRGSVPAPLPFELAALLCGHNPSTATGAADARADHRVWDLVGVEVLVVHHSSTRARS